MDEEHWLLTIQDTLKEYKENENKELRKKLETKETIYVSYQSVLNKKGAPGFTKWKWKTIKDHSENIRKIEKIIENQKTIK